jgi:hypothetical protein
MARTVGQVVQAARAIIQDAVPPFRTSDSDLAGYVSEAMGEARRVRPDLFLTMLRDPLPVYTQADFAVAIPLPDSYFSQVVNFVAGRADLREDAFAQDGRAITLISAFGVSLVGSGGR